MTKYTADAHALPYPEGVDKVAVHGDIQALATKTGLAISTEGGRAEAAAKDYTSAELAKDRIRLEVLETATVPAALADAKTYADTEVSKDRVRLGTLEKVAVPKALTDAKAYADTKAPGRREALVPLDDLRAPGGHWYKNAFIAGNPFPGKFITVEVEDFAPFGTAVIQTAKPSSGAALPAYRTYTGAVWTPWVYNTDAAEVAAVKAQLQAFLASPPVSSGSKIVPLAITAAQGPFMEVMPRNSARWVRRWAVAPTRMRIHIANRNPAQGNTGDAVTLNGIWVGKGGADGSVTNASDVLGTKALPSSGAEVVTPWFSSPVNDGEYLVISTAWFGADGARVALMQGGGWVSSGSTNAQDATVAGAAWSRKQATPFHVWVEAEVPASTPVICGHGDSITIGTAAVDPVGDSFIARYAHAQGALPVILAEHGSTMAGWISTPRRWTQYPGMNLPAIIDATITTMGQNDLAAAGITVAELQKRHRDMMPLLSANVGGTIYTGLVTPSSKSADLEVIRKEYNAWLATLPTGARGVFDFATAVGTADGEALRPEFSADGLHPNAAGQQAMADVVIARPATPFNLAPSKMKALAALL